MLSRQSVSTLVDILENRISVMEVTDRDDMRELSIMKRCLNELSAIGTATMEGLGSMGEIDFAAPRRGRRPKRVA